MRLLTGVRVENTLGCGICPVTVAVDVFPWAWDMFCHGGLHWLFWLIRVKL
jgi:hypothetical protein